MKKIEEHSIGTEPCSYYDTGGKVSRYIFFKASNPNQVREQKFELMGKGMFGQSDVSYATDCTDCNECVPVRINSDKFNISGEGRRTLSKNKDLKFSFHDPVYDSELYSLFKSYQKQRHPDSSMADYSVNDFKLMMSKNSDMMLIRNQENQLLAMVLVDVHGDAMSLEHVFYDYEQSKKRSLGKLAYIQCVDFAQKIGIKHLYNGAWAKDSVKLDYKKDFSGLEVFSEGSWKSYDSKSHIQGSPYKELIASITLDE